MSDTHPSDPDANAAVGRKDLPDPLADRDLLAGVRRRERDALGRFFDHAFPHVYNLAFRLTGNRAVAEDLTQDVFLKIHHAAERLDENRNARPWITTITVNACRDRARSIGRRGPENVDPADVEHRLVESATPEDGAVRAENIEQVHRALAALEPDLREVIVLRDWCGHGHDEIAEIVGASHAAVRKRYSRGLGRLREIIRSFET